MTSVATRATLLAAALMVVAGGTARASAIEVKVPFPFVIQGHQFPAGDYRLQRDEMDSSIVSIRGERGNVASMFLMTMPAAGPDPAGERPALTFDRYENVYRLTDIWESAGSGREVMPRK